jgi:hypothetical protein
MNAPLPSPFSFPAALAAQGPCPVLPGNPFFTADGPQATRIAGSRQIDRSAEFLPSDNSSVRLPRRCQSLQENHRHD